MIYECQIYDMDGRKLQKIMCTDYEVNAEEYILVLKDCNRIPKAVIYYQNCTFVLRAQYID